jgi:hypothetical protein
MTGDIALGGDADSPKCDRFIRPTSTASGHDTTTTAPFVGALCTFAGTAFNATSGGSDACQLN